jgi:hypothetical protein
MPALARIVNLLSLTKCLRYVTISANNSMIWTLLSRGVEGPALRSPGNQGSRVVIGRIVLGQDLDHQTKDQMTT